MPSEEHVSWREWRSRFPGGMTWREFLGFIRDDTVMKMRLAILVGAFVMGVVVIVAVVRWV